MSSSWVASHKEPTGYDVRDSRKGRLLGWVRFDRDAPAGEWRAFCRSRYCHELGQGGTKAEAVEIVSDHDVREHGR